MSKIQTNKIQHTANGAAEFTLPQTDGSANQVLKTDGSGALSFTTVSGTTINNNADNRLITGSNTANTLNGESTLTYNGTKLTFEPPTNSSYEGFHILPAGGTTASSFVVRGNMNTGAATGRNGGVVYIDANYYLPASDVFTLNGRGTQILNIIGEGRVYHTTGDYIYSASVAGAIRFRLLHTGGGHIAVSNPTSGGVSYSTSSDYRLKENESTINNALTTVKALKPYQFTWKHDSKVGQGFFAHEVLETTPNSRAVLGTKDAVDSEGNPEYQQLDYSKLVPLLTAALQEAVAKIETLETKVAALEAA